LKGQPIMSSSVGAGASAQLSLEGFLDQIASAEILPGGGYVAAVSVAMAAGLVAMAARLSRDEWAEARGAAAQAEALRFRGLSLAERNARAYEEAVAVLQGNDGTEADSRDDAIADALERAAEVPLRIAEAATDVGALAAEVAERCSPSVRADVGVAALLSQAGARACTALIAVNLLATHNDERLVLARELEGSASKALQRALDTIE
jgi:formiminotetrahydrofolate cyclodeaminase